MQHTGPLSLVLVYSQATWIPLSGSTSTPAAALGAADDEFNMQKRPGETCCALQLQRGLSSSMPFRPCIAGRSAASAKHDAYTARPACAYRCRLCDFSALHSACRFTLVVAVWLLVATLSLNGCDKPSLVASASTPGSSMARDVRLYAATTTVVAVKPSRFRTARMSGHQHSRLHTRQQHCWAIESIAAAKKKKHTRHGKPFGKRGELCGPPRDRQPWEMQPPSGLPFVAGLTVRQPFSVVSVPELVAIRSDDSVQRQLFQPNTLEEAAARAQQQHEATVARLDGRRRQLQTDRPYACAAGCTQLMDHLERYRPPRTQDPCVSSVKAGSDRAPRMAGNCSRSMARPAMTPIYRVKSVRLVIFADRRGGRSVKWAGAAGSGRWQLRWHGREAGGFNRPLYRLRSERGSKVCQGRNVKPKAARQVSRSPGLGRMAEQARVAPPGAMGVRSELEAAFMLPWVQQGPELP
ncbi:hypothetical protein L1887_48972 [Cichorium endivia]|nr:hypothetical protein L1887_48972 [Cichorium endivia]